METKARAVIIAFVGVLFVYLIALVSEPYTPSLSFVHYPLSFPSNLQPSSPETTVFLSQDNTSLWTILLHRSCPEPILPNGYQRGHSCIELLYVSLASLQQRSSKDLQWNHYGVEVFNGTVSMTRNTGNQGNRFLVTQYLLQNQSIGFQIGWCHIKMEAGPDCGGSLCVPRFSCEFRPLMGNTWVDDLDVLENGDVVYTRVPDTFSFYTVDSSDNHPKDQEIRSSAGPSKMRYSLRDDGIERVFGVHANESYLHRILEMEMTKQDYSINMVIRVSKLSKEKEWLTDNVLGISIQTYERLHPLSNGHLIPSYGFEIVKSNNDKLVVISYCRALVTLDFSFSDPQDNKTYGIVKNEIETAFSSDHTQTIQLILSDNNQHLAMLSENNDILFLERLISGESPGWVLQSALMGNDHGFEIIKIGFIPGGIVALIENGGLLILDAFTPNSNNPLKSLFMQRWDLILVLLSLVTLFVINELRHNM